MRQFIRVEGAPYQGFGAFAPLPTTTPAGCSHGVVRTTAQLGTEAIPVSAPDLPPISADPKTKPSNCAPNFFRPVIYVAHADYMAPPVPTEIDNVMPMPIPNVAYVPQSSTHKQRIGGIAALRWPRALIKWPTVGQGAAT